MLEIARDFDLDVPYRDADKFRELVQVREGEPLTHGNFLGKFKTIRKFFLDEEVIRRIKTRVDDAGNCTAQIGGTKVTINADGQWSVKR